MPPKRSRSSVAAPTAVNKKTKTTIKTKVKTTKKTTRTREIREDSPPEKDFDSYDDAVRDAILNTSKSRYDVSLEQDHLAFAAALMESSSLSLEQGGVYFQEEKQTMLGCNGIGGGEDQARTHTGTRTGAQARVYSLGTFCLHAVVKHFERLAVDAISMTTLTSATSSAATKASAGPGTRAIGTGDGGRFRRQVQQLPFYLSERLFKVLKHTRPELLSTKIWTSLFFNPETTSGDRIEDLDLEGLIPSQVTDTVIRSHLLRQLGIGPRLTRINLNHQTGVSDKCVADLVSASTRLVKLSVKGCAKVGDLTLASLPSETIEELNISFVGVGCTVKGLSAVVYRCKGLKVFKCAGVANVKDAVFVQLEKSLALEEEQQKDGGGGGGSGNVDSKLGLRPLTKLENLKISTTSLGDRGLKALLALCGRSLRRLDISQTNITRPSMIGQYCVWEDSEGGGGGAGGTGKILAKATTKMATRLEKLNLTRLTMSTAIELWTLIRQLPPNSLHTLLMGYITHSRSVINENVFDLMSSSHFEEEEEEGVTLTSQLNGGSGGVVVNINGTLPAVLRSTPKFFLRTLSLFGNNELGPTGRDRGSLRWLLSTLSPYLKRLELGYTRYDHQVLLGLIDPPRSRRPDPEVLMRQVLEAESEYNDVLEELGMDATRIGDESAVVLAKLRGLRRLSLANTQISKEAIEVVVEGCAGLTSLDLTSCRGVPVVQRRTLLKDIRQGVSSSLSS
ncbi:MAG: hypothetical protein J3R72DRAFT_506418 [Linnemannia gamsii]|nr:MAG: hypothetical protein J3R72DRAFT_506418 [Linnemannia gamsii]